MNSNDISEKSSVLSGGTPVAALPSPVRRKRVNLALQGGGSHGAFTWGVLDRLLEDGRIDFEGVSGTSAGGINAAVLASGLAKGGPGGARKALADFWTSLGDHGAFSPLRRGVFDRARGKYGFDYSLSYRFFNSFTSMVSPYQWNPMNYNPLMDLVRRHVDFEAVKKSGLKLFVSATCVETGRIRVFRTAELDEDRVMASAAVPFMFQAVEIEGRHYWDGGFCGNPALFPLFYECESADMLIIQINPQFREKLPRTVYEIDNRAAEISFNVSLAAELRAIDFVNRIVEQGAAPDERYRRLHIHLVECEAEMQKLAPATKLLTEPAFLKHMRDLGREAAEEWLKKHFDDLGVRSSVDVRETFLDDDRVGVPSADEPKSTPEALA
jgi:NTE family protein